MLYRIEKDSIGEINVPIDTYWGAQTQRSIQNFNIGTEKIPYEMIIAYAYLKKSLALVNNRLKLLTDEKKDAIVQACEEIIEGKFDKYFPLSVWQTGSGTQTNMNINEVIANRATEILGFDFRVKKAVHPNDDVNRSQSSNDTFPTAMHISSLVSIKTKLLPAIQKLKQTFELKQEEFKGIVKIGRTHLQDATPLSLAQELSGYIDMLDKSYTMIENSSTYLKELAIGGTAVGTGINCHPKLGEMAAKQLSKELNIEFKTAPNKFQALSSHDAITFTHGALKTLASDLMKIANDIRWLSSGPRCGIGELKIPANEPGSSIMPGKVNPTQSEALTMVAVQVMGNDTAIAIAASQGNFELNVFKPLIIYNFLQSINLLSDAINSFNDKCIKGLEVNKEMIQKHLENSLMLVTSLTPYIGYEKAASIAKYAYENNITLKEAALKLKLLSEKEYDKYINIASMV